MVIVVAVSVRPMVVMAAPGDIAIGHISVVPVMVPVSMHPVGIYYRSACVTASEQCEKHQGSQGKPNYFSHFVFLRVCVVIYAGLVWAVLQVSTLEDYGRGFWFLSIATTVLIQNKYE